MSTPDDLKDMIREADCSAPEALRQRLWNSVTDTLCQSRNAFVAHIEANMALDLDPKAAVPLRDTQPGDFDVIWDTEGGGSLKVAPGSSARLWPMTLIKPPWDGAIWHAYEHLDEIKASPAVSVVPTEETPFAAVLTGEGSLAIVQIHRFNESHAILRWRVEKVVGPGYGPVQIVTLQSIDENSAVALPAAIDFDAGKVVEIPPHVLQLPTEQWLEWLEQNGVDAIARISDEGDGLVGVGLVFQPWMASCWASTDPVHLRQSMAKDSYQPRRRLLFHEDSYQTVFPFKTRDGMIGMLQLLAVDKAKQTVQFRYRMLLAEGGETNPENDIQSQRLADSVHRLMEFGLLVSSYACHHEAKYPTSLEELRASVEKHHQDYQWIVENVEYLGAGKTARDLNAGETVLAYDKTLLKAGKGTHAVFRDGHASFIEPKRLSQYGIPNKTT
jgi:hypothetical protein